MTREEIMGLEGRELDRAVHRSVFGVNVEAKMFAVYDGLRWRTIPGYSSDHNAARLVLAEVERRGLERQFTCRWFEEQGMDTDKVMRLWDAFNATPAQICRAALLAMTK